MDPNLLLKFYGLDWLNMVFVFATIYLLGNKNRNGFLFGPLSSLHNSCYQT